jgi:hypothetical protein
MKRLRDFESGSQRTPSSTVTSDRGVIASRRPAIGALGAKRFGPGDRRRLSCRWDEARHASIITLNLCRGQLTWQCRCEEALEDRYAQGGREGHHGQDSSENSDLSPKIFIEAR